MEDKTKELKNFVKKETKKLKGKIVEKCKSTGQNCGNISLFYDIELRNDEQKSNGNEEKVTTKEELKEVLT